MTPKEALRFMTGLGYDVVTVLDVVSGWVVWTDTVGNVRIKDTRQKRFNGLRGAFYANHTGQGETALEAAVEQIRQNEGY